MKVKQKTTLCPLRLLCEALQAPLWLEKRVGKLN